jgi:hypothetical protein
MRAFPVLASLERGRQNACAPVLYLISYEIFINANQELDKISENKGFLFAFTSACFAILCGKIFL